MNSARFKTMLRATSVLRIDGAWPCLLVGCGLMMTTLSQAQYFAGIGGSQYFLAATGLRVTDASAFDVGACLLQRTDEPLGYAAHIVWQRRRFHSQGYEVMTGSDRYFEFDMRVDMLVIGCDARIALNEDRKVFFDVGPDFCFQFSEDKDGIAFTQIYAVNDTITYHHVRRSFFALHDVRFRTGLSGDVPLSQNSIATFGMHLSIGGGGWTPGGPIISWGLQASAGLLFALPDRRKRK